MSIKKPEYRLTLYAPRSVDATETTVLAPVGSIHSDSFQVTTEQAPPTGWRSYLAAPEGRDGRFDPLTKKLDTGEYSAFLIDKNVAGHSGTRLKRWVTAFLGDAVGRPRMLGVKAVWKVSYDGGTNFSTLATHRVSSLRLATKGKWEIVTRDNADDLNTPIFTGRPHNSITYAGEPRILPIGISVDYGTIKKTPPLTGTFKTVNGVRVIRVSTASLSAPENTVTRALMSGGIQVPNLSADTKHFGIMPDPDVRVKFTAGGATDKELMPLNFRIRPFVEGTAISVGLNPAIRGGWRVYEAVVDSLEDTTDPYYYDLASISDNTTCTFSVIKQRRASDLIVDDEAKADAPSEEVPIIVTDVNPVQFLADILDGKFGELQVGGVVVRSFPRKTSTFTPLIADTSIQPMRFIIDKVWKLNEFVEKHLLLPNQLGWRINVDGEIELFDMRFAAGSAPSSVTLTDDDLALRDDQPDYDISRDEAVTRFRASLYYDIPSGIPDFSQVHGIPDASLNGITPIKRTVNERDFGNPDLGEKMLSLDLLGLRATPGELYLGRDRFLVMVAQVIRVMEPYRQFFGSGPIRYRAKFRRFKNGAVNAGANAQIGDWRVLQISHLPDPLTGLRGQTRLMMVTERSFDHDGVWLSFIDAGPNSVLGAPSLASYAKNTDDPKHAVQVAVTTNAAGDPTVVSIAVTTTSVGSRPADDSSLWHPVFNLRGKSRQVTGTCHFRGLPAGSRIWIRAQSVPTPGSGARLPSSYAYPATASIDLDTLTACTTVSTSGLTTASVTITWSNNGDNDSWIELLIASPSGGTLVRDDVLSPGATAHFIGGLDLLTGPDVKVVVRHIDNLGGVSADASVTFTPAGSPPTASAMGSLSLIAGTP